MKRISREEEKQLTEEEYQNYYYYLRNRFEKSRVNKLSVKTRKMMHPLLMSVIRIRNRLNGYQLKILGDERSRARQPIIYAVTHIGKADIEIASEVIREHFYLLSGDFENLHDTVDGWFLGVNGVLYFNENNKEDRHNVKKMMIMTLREGGSLLYFPEGTWNLTPNLPVNPLYMGIIDVALKSNAIIIPIAIEQYGKQFISKVGENLDVMSYGEENRSQALTELRDRLATLKWDIWESTSPMVRANIPDNCYANFIDKKLSEWPTLTLKDFLDAVYRNIYTIPPNEVFCVIKKLECRKETAFLFDKRNIGMP